MMARPFFSSCVSWCENAPLDVLEWLCEKSDEISLSDLRSRVDADDMARLVSDLGYAVDNEAGLRIEDDYHVRYKLDRRSGVPFIVHSAIEYVFATEDDIKHIEAFVEMDAEMEMQP